MFSQFIRSSKVLLNKAFRLQINIYFCSFKFKMLCNLFVLLNINTILYRYIDLLNQLGTCLNSQFPHVVKKCFMIYFKNNHPFVLAIVNICSTTSISLRSIVKENYVNYNQSTFKKMLLIKLLLEISFSFIVIFVSWTSQIKLQILLL